MGKQIHCQWFYHNFVDFDRVVSFKNRKCCTLLHALWNIIFAELQHFHTLAWNVPFMQTDCTHWQPVDEGRFKRAGTWMASPAELFSNSLQAHPMVGITHANPHSSSVAGEAPRGMPQYLFHLAQHRQLNFLRLSLDVPDKAESREMQTPTACTWLPQKCMDWTSTRNQRSQRNVSKYQHCQSFKSLKLKLIHINLYHQHPFPTYIQYSANTCIDIPVPLR